LIPNFDANALALALALAAAFEWGDELEQPLRATAPAAAVAITRSARLRPLTS
jgi:hypothetical protein